MHAAYNMVKERPKLYLQCADDSRVAMLREHGTSIVAVLGSAESPEVLTNGCSQSRDCATAVVDDTTSVLLELGSLHKDKELKRLQEQKV